MITDIDIYTYRKIESSIEQSSHPISEGRLPNTKEIWICKTARDEKEARFEQLAQELFRLVIPHQPKTQIARGKAYSANRTYYLLSEKIEDFRALSPEHSTYQLTPETEVDLGKIMMSAIILHEVDLQCEHIGFNALNRLTKIDGDFTLAALAHPKIFQGLTTEITSKLINTLPFIQHYYVYNWLDIVKAKKNHNTSRIVSPTLSASPHFQEGINQAILCFLLLPSQYLEQFISLYMPEDKVANIYETFLKRQVELKRAAMENESFLKYLTGCDAEKTMNEHLVHMKNFAAHLNFPVIAQEQHAALEERCITQFDALKVETRMSPESITYEFALSISIPKATARRPSFDRNRMFSQSIASSPISPKKLVIEPGGWITPSV